MCSKRMSKNSIFLENGGVFGDLNCVLIHRTILHLYPRRKQSDFEQQELLKQIKQQILVNEWLEPQRGTNRRDLFVKELFKYIVGDFIQEFQLEKVSSRNDEQYLDLLLSIIELSHSLQNRIERHMRKVGEMEWSKSSLRLLLLEILNQQLTILCCTFFDVFLSDGEKTKTQQYKNKIAWEVWIRRKVLRRRRKERILWFWLYHILCPSKRKRGHTMYSLTKKRNNCLKISLSSRKMVFSKRFSDSL